MSTKTLIAVGDSFTDPKMYSFIDKVWPDYISEKNINLGKSGSSNQYIFNAAIDAIENSEDKDLFVIACWTDSHRFNLFDITTGWLDSPEFIWKKFEQLEKNNKEVIHGAANKLARVSIYSKMINEQETDLANAYFKVVDSSLRCMYLLEEYCTLKGIEYYHFSGLDPIADKTILEAMTSHPNHTYSNTDVLEKGINKVKTESIWYNKLNKSKKFLGFDWNSDSFIRANNWTISKDDGHPNAKGQEMIANVIHKFITTGQREKINLNDERFKYIYD